MGSSHLIKDFRVVPAISRRPAVDETASGAFLSLSGCEKAVSITSRSLEDVVSLRAIGLRETSIVPERRVAPHSFHRDIARFWQRKQQLNRTFERRKRP